ncbi:proline-rich proteoglycan 2-like [Diceros bicornis minor]|uniref:proline-rich proteoglycan 2-like n=1 Tax=Diceros bicornis minor TaxID=77932 RepID=UPI0026EF38CA|nr:proline-rich proteoglycan 2-like [Diceros bicornis minor]
MEQGSRGLAKEVLKLLPPAHTRQTSFCSCPQLPASSGDEHTLQALKHGGNRPLPAGPKVALLSAQRESQFPSKGNLGAPLGTPSSQVRAEGSEQEGAAPHDPSLGFSSGPGHSQHERTPLLALQGPWEESPDARPVQAASEQTRIRNLLGRRIAGLLPREFPGLPWSPPPPAAPASTPPRRPPPSAPRRPQRKPRRDEISASRQLTAEHPGRSQAGGRPPFIPAEESSGAADGVGQPRGAQEEKEPGVPEAAAPKGSWGAGRWGGVAGVFVES